MNQNVSKVNTISLQSNLDIFKRFNRALDSVWQCIVDVKTMTTDEFVETYRDRFDILSRLFDEELSTLISDKTTSLGCTVDDMGYDIDACARIIDDVLMLERCDFLFDSTTRRALATIYDRKLQVLQDIFFELTPYD